MEVIGGLIICIIIYFMIKSILKIIKWKAKKDYHRELTKKELEMMKDMQIRQLMKERDELLKRK